MLHHDEGHIFSGILSYEDPAEMNQAALMVEGYELEVCKCCGLIVLRLLLTSLIYLYSRRLRWTAVTMKVCVVSRIIMIMIIWYLCCAASDMSCFCRICY